ncbi:type II secretion system protein [Kribbella flavida DSM 17836]|uniref:Type II secretion system protein n=1 Tax=Kribbella flavida (strain DSM 17836 / JCM 10339 / NBRC 14399) TaxID=479435 RepID=D2PNE7_KRIFD|nr:type II secretion system F family protein [Kribbella flavida]ADB30799.1 type II secretion system protein [Kribbella flavida DSM 17836]
MGLLLGLFFGIGVLLLVWTFVAPREEKAKTDGRLVARSRDLLARAGVEGVTPGAFIGACLITGFVAFVLMFLVSAALPVGVVFGLMAGGVPVAVLKSRARKRLAEFRELWPDVVDNIASAVRAGLSLSEALAQVGERGPLPLREPFRRFGADYASTGRFAESLDRLKARLADPVGDRVVEALRIAREVGGGDLGRLLRSLSSFLRDDARTRSELESRQSWSVNGARVAVAAPWLVLGLLSFQGDVIQRYNSPVGALVIGIGAAVCVLAYRVMLRIGRLPEPERVLR